MTIATLEAPDFREWIGREDRAQEDLTAALVERFHRTLDLPGEPGGEGTRAPRLIHLCLCQPAAATATLNIDGHVARGQFLPPVPLPRRMWAAGEIEFHGDLTIGGTVQRISRVADISFKNGQSGQLCFVTVDHRIEQDGVLKITDRQTIVFRDDPRPVDGAAPSSPVPAPDDIVGRPVRCGPELLFRYSALTFNTHRIHYDRPYAIEEEGYGGLVVQGPLQATLLLHFAAQTAGGVPPDTFAFRSLAPVFDIDEIRLVAGVREANGRDLWTACARGPVAMKARATWS